MKASTAHVENHDNIENLDNATLHHAAERGQAATDKYEISLHFWLYFSMMLTLLLVRYGQPLVEYDPVAERRLRTKIDLYIIPTVALLYLFCFIDRANLGEFIRISQPRHQQD